LTKAPRTYIVERTVSSINGSRKTGYPHVKEEKISPLSLTIFKTTNANWNKDLNIRPNTNKLLDEDTGETLQDIDVRVGAWL
jgi:hypothetical protein